MVDTKSNASRQKRLTMSNLSQIENTTVGSLHETDIFKICIKTL